MELLTAVVGALIGAAATAAAGIWQARRVTKQRRREEAAKAKDGERHRLEELRRLLQRSGQLFNDQATVRDRLVESLRKNHPQLHISRPGYENLFSEFFASMTAEERLLHSQIVGLTEEALFSANRELQHWLAQNGSFRVISQPTEGRAELARQLDLLEQHLDGWFAKFQRVFRANPDRGVVYLADEDKLGPRFPQALEAVLDEILRQPVRD